MDLNYAGVAFNRIADTAKSGGCGIATAVSLMETPTPLSRPVEVDCGLAQKMARWDREVLQPLALKTFGQPLKTIHHFGGYVCRPVRNRSSRMSEHSFGRAVDISAFELADGTMVSVHRDWPTGGRKAEFLREAAAGACGLFNVVLTPNTDRNHANHFHLDTGPWKLCSL